MDFVSRKGMKPGDCKILFQPFLKDDSNGPPIFIKYPELLFYSLPGTASDIPSFSKLVSCAAPLPFIKRAFFPPAEPVSENKI